MSQWHTDEKKIDEAAAKFPPAFGLRAYKDRLFRVNRSASYCTDGRVVLYTTILATGGPQAGQWLDFIKGSFLELKREICCVRCRRPAGTRLDPVSNEFDGLALNTQGLCLDCGT
jgi:hypothetical protein